MRNLGGNIANILMAPIAESEAQRKKAESLANFTEQQKARFEENEKTNQYREMVDTLSVTVWELKCRVDSLETELSDLQRKFYDQSNNPAPSIMPMPQNYTPLM